MPEESAENRIPSQQPSAAPAALQFLPRQPPVAQGQGLMPPPVQQPMPPSYSNYLGGSTAFLPGQPAATAA
jgi:hypothetical protein